MQTTITYNIPEDALQWILELLGYKEWNKEEYMNERITNVVIPAIAQTFLVLKQNRMQDALSRIPQEIDQSVRAMISITTE